MLTVSEIENKKFSKSIIGGYDTEDVNEFLNIVADDYDRLLSENDTLKGKLKLLVEKLQEYRDIEDSLRKALFTAEKTADKVKEEARHRCESMLKDTQLAIEKEKREAARQLKSEIARLQEAKNQTASFVKNCMALYNKQIQLLTTIPNLHIEIDEETDQAELLTPKEMAVRSAAREISKNIVRAEDPAAPSDSEAKTLKEPEEIILTDNAKQVSADEAPKEEQSETIILPKLDTAQSDAGEAASEETVPHEGKKQLNDTDESIELIDFNNTEIKSEEPKKTDEPQPKANQAQPKRKGLEVKVIELNLNKPIKSSPKFIEEPSAYDEEDEPSIAEKLEDLKFGKKFDIRKNRE